MISIIVPNYNHYNFLPQRLDTIFNQTFQDFEVILLDDCSTDGSWDYLKTFENHPKVSHCIRNETNSGSPFKQWQKGMELAKYEWIWIAESDDFSDLCFLEKNFEFLEDSVSIVFCKSKEVDQFGQPYFGFMKPFFHEEIKILEASFSLKGKTFIRQYLIYSNYLKNASSVIFKKPKEFPSKILDMKYSGDWFFWIFLLKEDDYIIYLNQDLNFFRCHFNTTRVFINHHNELLKKVENFSCINFAYTIIGLQYLPSIDFFRYKEDVQYYFNTIHRLGRFRMKAIFPKIPFWLYPIYYSIFFKSLISKKFID